MPNNPYTLQYRPEIDGLRAVAILPVILFHLGLPAWQHGYLGVDVFFVLSGYLITGKIFPDIMAGRFSWKNFYTRRAKRLLPALLTVILTFLCITALCIFKPQVNAYATDALNALFFCSNFHFMLGSGNYWGASAGYSYLLHTWSLAVEEQFYLLFPLLLLLFKNVLKRNLLPVYLVTAFSFISCLAFMQIKNKVAFFMLPTRFWELGLGAIIAIKFPKQPFLSPKRKSIVTYAAVFLVILGFFFPFQSGESLDLTVLLPTIGTAVLVMFCSSTDPIGAFLSQSWMTYIGKISYALYLWHWPWIVLYKNLKFQLYDYNETFLRLLIIALTVLCASLSYAFIENRIRYRKKGLKTVGALYVLALVGSFYFTTDQYRLTYPSKYQKEIYAIRYYDISPSPANTSSNKPINYNNILLTPPNKNKYAYKDSGIVKIIKNKKPAIVTIGDSQGAMWGLAIDEIADTLHLSRTFYTTNGSLPLIDLYHIDNQQANRFFTKQERIDFAASFRKNLSDWQPRLAVFACKWTNLAPKDWEQLGAMITFLRAENIQILLISQIPDIQFFFNENAGQYFSYLFRHYTKIPNTIPNYNNENVVLANQKLDQLAHRLGCKIFDSYRPLLKNNRIIISQSDHIFYFDDDHLSYSGTQYLKKRLASAISDIVR